MADLKITQRRSTIGRPPEQRRTIHALGLRRIGHSVVRPDNPSIRGMVFSVQHIVEVEEVGEKT
jgi:large subunit ribosomal protein L30